MRVDFREERKWKLALAFNLAQAVVEWHEAGTKEEREKRGICLNWRKPKPADEVDEDAAEAEMQLDIEDLPVEADEDTNGESKSNSTPANEENSDDDSDDEQDREQRAAQDAVASQAAIDEALGEFATSQAQEAESQTQTQSQPMVTPKLEDIEDRSALHRDDTMDVDKPSGSSSPKKTEKQAPKKEEGETVKALKKSSDNPILAGSAEPSNAKSKVKGQAYAPLREQIVYSELDKLVLDLDDLGLSQSTPETASDEQVLAMPPPADITSIFPDLQPYGLLDVAPAAPEGKKKDRRADRDDPNRRSEDTTYQKLTPMSEFIFNRTALVGSLRPSRHWRGGRWENLDETPIVADADTPAARSVDDSAACSE